MLGTLCFLLFVTNVYGICLNSYEDIGNGICYKTFAIPKLRTEAEMFCENYGGNLVAPQNAFVNAQIQQEAQDLNSHVWLGLTCSGTDVTSCTYSDGNQVTNSSFTNFAPGHPNSGFGRCVYLAKSGGFSGRWISGVCDEEIHGFGCAIKPSDMGLSCGSTYSEFNGFCYKILPPSSYTDAESACGVECAHLTSIHTQEENDFARNISAQQSAEIYARIGLRVGTNENYEWVDGTVSSQTDFSNFGHSEPALGSCVGMALRDDAVKSGKWINTQCTVNITSICKRVQTAPCLSFSAAPTEASSTELPPGYVSTLAPSTCSSNHFLQGNGTIYSPGYPNNFTLGLHCEYVVSAPNGSVVYFSLDRRFDNAATSPINLYNSIEDTWAFAKSLKYPGTYHASTGPLMKITFDSGVARDKWSANYHTVDLRPSGCNQDVLKAPGAITSPNYPVPYPEFYKCNYQLEAAPGKRILLHFDYILIATDVDYIRIWDGDSDSGIPIEKFSPPHTGWHYGRVDINVTSTGNHMFVQFTSGDATQYYGWAATFTSF